MLVAESDLLSYSCRVVGARNVESNCRLGLRSVCAAAIMSGYRGTCTVAAMHPGCVLMRQQETRTKLVQGRRIGTELARQSTVAYPMVSQPPPVQCRHPELHQSTHSRGAGWVIV